MSGFLEFHKINFELTSFSNLISEITFLVSPNFRDEQTLPVVLAFCANLLFKIIKLFKSSVIYQEKLTAVVFFPTVEAK